MLTAVESQLLSSRFQKLQHVLDPGFSHLNWNSLGISDFVSICMKAINEFKSLVIQVQNNSSSIQKAVEAISKLNLIHFNPHGKEPDYMEFQEFYEHLEEGRQKAVAEALKQYPSISPLLMKLEEVVVATNTGASPVLVDYYYFWERKIFEALNQMVLNGLVSLHMLFQPKLSKKGSTEAHAPVFLKLFKVNCYLNKPDMVLQPSLNDITTTLALLVRNLVDSARPFVRWTDGTYMHNLDGLISKVCGLARESGEEDRCCRLRAASLQAISAMVWLMGECSHISSDFDEIVYVTLDNYRVSPVDREDNHERSDSHHNWVKEVLRCEGRGAIGMMKDSMSNFDNEKPRPHFKNPSTLTSKEMETPKVWSQICIQNMVRLAKETTTVRRVLEPIFQYFDMGKHWSPEHGLALFVLSDMSYLMQSTGNDSLLLVVLVRHLDHKNVTHQPQMKTDIVQIACILARQSRSKPTAAEVGAINDLSRHLRKSLQATMEAVGPLEANWNASLQNAIEECLAELVKRVGDAGPIFDMMALALEKLSVVGVVARATIGAMAILAHIIASISYQSCAQQDFPEPLFHQLLRAMVHPDVETRVAAHRIFAVLLVPTSVSPRPESVSFQSDSQYDTKKTLSKPTSAFASAAALFEKLRKEKIGLQEERNGSYACDETKERDGIEEEWKQDGIHKSPTRFYSMNRSIVDLRTISSSPKETEMSAMRLNGDQAAQLLSALWIQANMPDNMPTNFEAIAHTFSLTLLFSRIKNSNHCLLVRSFQLALSLRVVSLDSNGVLPPSRRRSLFTLATSMLVFAAKAYNIPEITEISKESLMSYIVDPYLELTDDFRLNVKANGDLREYGSISDDRAALSSLSAVRLTEGQSNEALVDIIVQSLSAVPDLDSSNIAQELSEMFSPDDGFAFGPQLLLESSQTHRQGFSKESISFDEVLPANSPIDDDLNSETSGTDLPRLLAKTSIPAPPPHIISVGQLLESALEAAGQVASAAVSTSPLPFSAMASQCEAFGASTRKRMSIWMNQDANPDTLLLTFPVNEESERTTVPQNYEKNERKVVTADKQNDQGTDKFLSSSHLHLGALPREPWQAMRLPPASPFDNFLKAAGC